MVNPIKALIGNFVEMIIVLELLSVYAKLTYRVKAKAMIILVKYFPILETVTVTNIGDTIWLEY